jgi:hypothetical protein
MPINITFAKNTLADCSSVHMSRQQICRVTGNGGLIEKAPSARRQLIHPEASPNFVHLPKLGLASRTGLRGVRD